jgi:REP element-mobilizing transposase RayT
MRQARIKVEAEKSPAVYHCVTRTVNGEWLFDDVAKEVLRKQLWQVADYCGVQIVTYAILSNHFHVLVHSLVPSIIASSPTNRRSPAMLCSMPNSTKCRCLIWGCA